MYELFILGELMDGALHGYLLREIINLAIGPVRQMSWGGLYPLLKRLETDGLIEQTADPEASGDRPRKLYRITARGQERFSFLMLRPDELGADYFDIFNTKMLNFDHLTPEQRADCITEYKEYLQFIHKQLLKSKQFVANEQHIAEAEKLWIKRCQDHRIHMILADLEWIESLEVELKNESP